MRTLFELPWCLTITSAARRCNDPFQCRRLVFRRFAVPSCRIPHSGMFRPLVVFCANAVVPGRDRLSMPSTRRSS